MDLATWVAHLSVFIIRGRMVCLIDERTHRPKLLWHRGGDWESADCMSSGTGCCESIPYYMCVVFSRADLVDI